MDIKQMLELYNSQDEDGRSKIIDDMIAEYNRLSTDNTELSGRNKSLQDMNRQLITTAQAPKIVREAEVPEEEHKIHIDDLFDVVSVLQR